jgi:hypothetical protein
VKQLLKRLAFVAVEGLGPGLGFAALPALGAAQHAEAAFGLGLSVPTGVFHADTSGAGYSVGGMIWGALEVPLPKTDLGIRFDVSYSSNSGNDQLNRDVCGLTSYGTPAYLVNPNCSSSMTILGGSADVTYTKGLGPVRLYALGGGGFYHVAEDNYPPGGTVASATNFAVNMGGGIAARRSSDSPVPFAEARFFILQAFSPISVNHFYVTVGLRIPSVSISP